MTGTNGKTTTTLLIGEMLKEDGKKVGVGGNVGEPLILFAEGGDRWEVLVVEISSFQLEAIEDVSAPNLSSFSMSPRTIWTVILDMRITLRQRRGSL